jgi:peptidyl-tRNA hydrolase
MKSVFIKSDQCKAMSDERVLELPPEMQRWLRRTSNKVVAACQTRVMMGLPQKDNFLGHETFRR